MVLSTNRKHGRYVCEERFEFRWIYDPLKSFCVSSCTHSTYGKSISHLGQWQMNHFCSFSFIFFLNRSADLKAVQDKEAEFL